MKINISRKIFLPIIILLMVGFVILDQAVKKTAISSLSASPFYFSDFLILEIYKNYGIAFGLPASDGVFYFIAFLFFIGLASGKLLSFKEMGKKEILAVGFILSGALGNLIDRIRFGYIIDYINLGDIVIFNLADMMIAAGAIMLIKVFVKHK
ncbi:signal peptidase II [Patescibacteria group bacterium]|nr:signal peptidase II [Patescibacteria group bacterium]MBU4580096.1 signal peptidase II [Patescibacteria group bacterium]